MNEIHIEKIFSFNGHTGAVYAIEQGPHPHLFYSGSGDHLIVEWNLKTHEEGTVLSKIPGIVYSLKYFHEKKLLFAGQSEGGIHVIDLVSRKEIKFLAYHHAPVFDLLLDEKHNLLISAGGDGYIHFISLDDFQLVKTMYFGQQKIRCLEMDHFSDQLVIGCKDGTIALVSLHGFKLETQWQAHQKGFSVYTALYISNGNLLITGGRDACLNIFDARNSFTLLESIPAHNYSIYDMATNPEQTLLATASRDKTLKIWDLERMTVLQRVDKTTHDAHVNSVNRLLWSPFTNRLLSAGDDRSILEWALK